MVNFFTYLEIYLDDMTKAVSLNEFATHFDKPHQTVKKHLEEFVTTRVLKQERKGRFLYYKLNLDNPLFKEHIIMCEKERLLLFLKNNPFFFILYKELSAFFKNSSFLLFGSSVTEKNYIDIDVLAISKSKKIKAVLEKLEHTYSKKIHLIQTEKKYMSKTLIKEIKNKHIILNGHESFYEVLYDY